MLRAVVVSIVIAVLGVLYILANPEDGGVKGFGWLLVAVGSVIAAVLTALWAREQFRAVGPGAAGGAKGDSSAAKDRRQARHRRGGRS